MKTRTFHIGGIHPDGSKLTAGVAAVPLPLPVQAVFPLSQHIGAPAKAVVQKGDKVKVGTLIAEASGFISASVHSSVSGTVVRTDNVFDASGYRKPAIIINVEGDEWDEGIDRSAALETLESHPELTPETIVERVRAAGVVGMGGACFPVHVKLSPPKDSKIDCVIINGVECEPYITADHRLMLECPDEIIEGVRLIMRAVGAPVAYIGIEDNKPDALRLFSEKLKDTPNIKAVPLRQKYPQGGEKQLVDAVIGRQVPAPPAIPASVGAVVQNVATAFAVYEAVMKRKPLLERYVTVTGKRLASPANFLVRMGTPASQLIAACGGLPDGDVKLLGGGPMMGKALVSADVPVCKGTNCITVLSGEDVRRKREAPCIRCAKCVEVCPMGLEPYLLATLSALREWERAEKEAITSCIECGSCQYTCPSCRPLLDNIRVGKATVAGMIKSRNAKKMRQ